MWMPRREVIDPNLPTHAKVDHQDERPIQLKPHVFTSATHTLNYSAVKLHCNITYIAAGSAIVMNTDIPDGRTQHHTGQARANYLNFREFWHRGIC
jgi:hypothetical protein